eukprot:30792-Rhodomonas_salina.1
MVSRREKAKSLEESDSEPDTPRRSMLRGTSSDRSVDGGLAQMELEGKGSAAKTGESREHMDKIEEGMGYASLRTPDGAKIAQGAANPLPGSETDGEAGARMDEQVQIQSRLPFVPQRPFCLDGVSDEETYCSSHSTIRYLTTARSIAPCAISLPLVA